MGETGLEERPARASLLDAAKSDTGRRAPRRIAQLERKNVDLEMENALLKKVRELERMGR